MARLQGGHAGGMKLTLKPYKDLTVGESGKKLIVQRDGFVFQCPPLEQFDVTRAFTTTNYDTIDNVQYSTIVSKSLKVFTFDTLIMELGVKTAPNWHHHKKHHGPPDLLLPNPPKSSPGHETVKDPFAPPKHKQKHPVEANRPHAPAWVPYPAFNSPGSNNPVNPEWYVSQLDKLVNSCAPFKFTAAWPNILKPGLRTHSSQLTPVLSCIAQLLSFDEVYKAGEGDAIYLSSVTFSEWRDPLQSQRGLGKGGGAKGLPTSVVLHSDGSVTHAGYRQKNATLNDLAKHFYHNHKDWKFIAQQNKIHGISQNEKVIKASKYKHLKKKQTAKINIPVLRKGKEQVYGP